MRKEENSQCWAVAQRIKPPYGTPASQRSAGSSPGFPLGSNSLLSCLVKQWKVAQLKFSPWEILMKPLASPWPSPSPCYHLESEPEISFSASSSLYNCLSNKTFYKEKFSDQKSKPQLQNKLKTHANTGKWHKIKVRKTNEI